MINIQPLRIKRFTAHLKELSIRDAIALAAIPNEMQHESASFFIKCAVERVDGSIQDPDLWTVQEQTMLICHYMSNTYDDGPDFSLSGNAKYSDYLAGTDYGVAEVDLGELEGDRWVARQLTGRLAKSIERLVGEVEGIEDYTFWQFALMAAQLVPNGDSGDELSDSDLDLFLLARLNVIAGFPESVFTVLLSKWHGAVTDMQHLINITFDKDGVVFASKGADGGVGDSLARFPAGSVVTELAKRLGGKYDR